MTPGYRTQAMIRRARRDHAPKDWLKRAQDDERRSMDALGYVLCLCFALAAGAVLADWLTGEYWTAEIVRIVWGAR